MDAHARNGLALDQSAPPVRAKVISLERYREASVSPSEDTSLNGEWDHLVRLAADAWSWRDPESLAVLGMCVAKLGLRALEDWER